MKQNENEVRLAISEVLESQRLAVLATECMGQPYSSLMAFAYTTDLTTMVVATGRATRKHMNLMAESRVSLLIDTRSNDESDFHAASAVTVIGKALEVPTDERKRYEELYLLRHPYLEKFIRSVTTALFSVSVDSYLLVNEFQNVMKLSLREDIFM